MQNRFIENHDVEAALDGFIEYAKIVPKTQIINASDALGRISSKPIFAKVCDPVYNASAMDGIAVYADDTFGASETSPVILNSDQYSPINTGGEIAKKYSAVVMIEDVVPLDNGKVQLTAPAFPWQHVRVIGENIVAGEMIIPSGHKIRPADIGALISGGVTKIEVYKLPMVGILPTGSEIVESPDELSSGHIIDSNSHMLCAQIKTYGADAKRYPPIGDDYEKLVTAVKLMTSECDMIIVNAGTSAGTKDWTLKIIEDLGEVFIHGLAMKPGKPTILGKIDEKIVIGLPGYPVSAYLTCQTIVEPLISKMTGNISGNFQKVTAKLTRSIVSSFKHREIIRVSLGSVDNKLFATPLDRGAANTMSLVKADGYLSVSRELEGMESGSFQEIELLKPLSEIESRLNIIGSHDLILDLVAENLPAVSSHVGSMGGLIALKNGECNIAPSHLLDENSGEYNVSYVKDLFCGKPMAIIKGVSRIQGFITEKGNPLKIENFADLANPSVTFANRQKGSGTRVLLDYNLKKLGVETKSIRGYEKEFTTHMAVAASIKSGSCNVGLGILSAAKALDLDFIPICAEEYDFVVYKDFLDDPKLVNFLKLITTENFKNTVLEIGGYSFDRTGEIIYV